MSINWTLTIGIIGYNVIIILAVSGWLAIRARKHGQEDFILSGRNLPWYVIAATKALCSIGGGHIIGLTSQAWATGTSTIWFGLSQAVMLCLMCLYTGPWYRRMGVTTVNQVFRKLYGPKLKPILTGVVFGGAFGILTLETQGLGSVVASVTGLQVWQGCLIGGIIGILYIVIAGMKEVGWVNLVNAILMYIGGILALIYIGRGLGGWQSVNDYYLTSGQEHMLHLFGNSEIVRVYVIGTFVSCLFFDTVSQQQVQSSMALKNVKELKKAVWATVPLNVMFGVIVIGLSLAAGTIPEITSTAVNGGMGVLAMCISYLPNWLCIWIIGVFMAAILSTFAMCGLGCATIFMVDIHEPYFSRGQLSPRKRSSTSRIYVLVLCGVGVLVGTCLPEVIGAITWVFSWLVPLFFILVFGISWKRSTNGAIATLVISWVVNCVLSLTPVLELLNIDGNNYAIVMAVVSILSILITYSVDKNAKPAYFKVYRAQREAYEAERGLQYSPVK